MARTALYGGSFNPIHYGHLLLAEDVRERLSLARVVFMPAGAPPHKPASELAPAEHRYAMARLAIADNPAFTVSDLEVRRPGLSYTHDTVGALGVPPDELFLVIGSETFLDLLSWQAPERLARRCRIVVVPRTGSVFDAESAAARKVSSELGLEGIVTATGDALPERAVIVAHATSLPISGSDVRERAAAGRSLTYRVPRPVADYIARHRLYGWPA